MATGLVVGAGVASTTLWYYSRRYLGELSLLPSGVAGQPPRLRLSVLDFWGNREVGWRGRMMQVRVLLLLPLWCLTSSASCLSILPSAALCFLPPHTQDNDVALQALVPPLAQLPEAAQRAAAMEPLLPLDVEGDRQYFLRWGTWWQLDVRRFDALGFSSQPSACRAQGCRSCPACWCRH